ncbi:MAG: nucleoside deaminase [Anaerolineae bacterium]|nr:nucleoside deaminase [Anaerolineae bacterium]
MTSQGETQEQYMRQVVALAAEALEQGEFPIAALVVLDGEIIARASTSEQREKRFLGHAELVALEEADRQHLSIQERRRACLYTNLEPCLMCLGAAMSFFLGEVVYSLESPGDGAVELVRGWARKKEDLPGYQVPRIRGGVLREETIRLFEEYVARSRPGPMRDWAETLVRLR